MSGLARSTLCASETMFSHQERGPAWNYSGIRDARREIWATAGDAPARGQHHSATCAASNMCGGTVLKRVILAAEKVLTRRSAVILKCERIKVRLAKQGRCPHMGAVAGWHCRFHHAVPPSAPQTMHSPEKNRAASGIKL